MHQARSKQPNLYFPQRITEAMGQILAHSLTIVEAPMGYGKTTSVREHMRWTDANLLWQNIYDDSKAAFWSGFCVLFQELDQDRSHNLAQLGFPDDSASMHTALMFLKRIALPARTVIVMDDFHLVDSQETARWITFLAANKILHLHIVLIARYFEFFPTQELTLKGRLHHIKKENFEFDQAEIVAYYALCGLRITQREAGELYRLTEGWISALYLLMLNFKKTGGISASVDIYKLIGQSVYDILSEDSKLFLLSMSMFPSFTAEQASYMMPDMQMQRIMEEISGKNAFITYDPLQNSYQLHSLFQTFLSNELKPMPPCFLKELYQKAAGWFFRSGDYLQSMRYAYLGEEFDALLCALEADRGQSINGEHKEALIRYFEACPMKSKINRPYAVLLYARRMFLFNEIALYRNTCAEFMEMYHAMEPCGSACREHLLGEYELLVSFETYNDVEKMADDLKQAQVLLKEPSLILDMQSSWTFGSPSVLYLYHRQSGALCREVEILQEIMPYYHRMTGSHGKGAAETMCAERFYYMGDFQNAEIAMHKAYQAAAESSDILLCVMFLHIKLRFAKGDFPGILQLFQQLRDRVFEHEWHMFIHTIDICEAYIFSGLGMNDKVAFWVQEGDVQNTRLLFPSLAYLNIVYGRVLLVNGEYTKLLGRAQEFLDTASVYPNLLAQMYACIYIAAANLQIAREDDALAALSYALVIAMPDQLYMPFVENGGTILPLLETLQARGMHTEGIAAIKKLYAQYHKAVRQMMRESCAEGTAALTERENEIAQLAAQGLSNKEIGRQLYISENTVKTQMKRVFQKLGIRSRSLLKQTLER